MIDSLPDAKTAEIAELAEAYAANFEVITAWSKWNYWAVRRLGEAIKDRGPIQTTAGKLSRKPDKFEYAPETAQIFPNLGRHKITCVYPTIAEAERAIEVMLTELPDHVPTHTVEVDAVLANRVIKDGGDAAKQLLDLRTNAGSLELR